MPDFLCPSHILAALTTYLNPSARAAGLGWWKKATESTDGRSVVKRLTDWTNAYLLRREKDVIADRLPKKQTQKQAVLLADLEV